MKIHAKLLKEETKDFSGTDRQVVSQVDMLKAEVSRDGLRAVDSGTFICRSRLAVNKGDVFKYVQDIANTNSLRGAYLFQGSCLDESGYNVDPINQTNSGNSSWNDFDGLQYEQNTTANHKFRGLFQAKLNSQDKGAILENKFHSNGTTPIHDFSGNFDIIAWITTPSSTGGTHMIYSKSNLTYGVSLKLIGTGSTFYIRGDVRKSGGSLKNVHTNTIKNVGVDTTICVRFRRVGTTLDIWLVDGSTSTPFGTPTNTYTTSYLSGDFNVSKQATIGSQASSFSGDNVTGTNNEFDGKLHQLRIYCGRTLDLSSANSIFSSRPIPLIMKLAGTVWKIESNLDNKRIFVKGFGKVITDTLVSSSLLDSGTATGEFYEYSGSRSTTAFTNAAPREIIRAIFAKLNVALVSNVNFKLNVRDLTGSATAINSYTAEGNFLEIINQLMVIVNKSFYVSPRGKCIIENKDLDMSNTLKFKNGSYNINANGFDDTNTVNDLYVSSRAGGNFNIVHAEDSTSINEIGYYSKRVLTPQLTDATSVTNFKNNFLSIYKDINVRYTITAPFLIDFIRENMTVKLINTIKSLDDTSTIKSITWHYPEARTVIETGDFLMDAFDLEKFSTETISNLVTDTNLNP